jgi:hypothetical protein
MHTLGVPTRDTDRHRGRRRILDLAAALPVVISDTEAVYLYGLDIIARQPGRDSARLNEG